MFSSPSSREQPHNGFRGHQEGEARERQRPEGAKDEAPASALGFGFGGLEKLLVEFARHANRDRFDLRFLSLGNKGEIARDIERLGWPVDTLDQACGLRPMLVWRLAQLLRRWKIDVLHTHNNRPLVYAALAARVGGVRRFIHTRHGQSFGSTPRQVRLVSVAARHVDAFVCVSKDCARLSLKQQVPARVLHCVHNGIDTTRFAALAARRDGPAVIVARLSPEKDIETLLRASAHAVQTDPTFRLEIAGDGPCRAALERLAAELNVDARVRFLGQVRDVAGLLARARLFVLSSISEGVSLTLLEAMARGLPVVATAVGGNPEVVVDAATGPVDATGLLVPPREPRHMAEALLRLHRCLDQRRRMGEAARRRVERHFDIRGMVSRYEALYAPRRCSEVARRAHNVCERS